VRFWQLDTFADPVAWVTNVLAIVGLLVVGWALVRMIAPLRRIGVPYAIGAGLLGLGLGPSGAGVLPTTTAILEVIVYHSFAAVFIAAGLQPGAPPDQRKGEAWSMGLAIPTVGVLQALLGFGLVALWLVIGALALHPGFGLMITLGFQQGPGQALALGGAWESLGMVHGGQIGLVFAALGFGYCIVLGIPLVALARRRGWIEPSDVDPIPRPAHAASGRTGWLVPLALVLAVYAVVYLLLRGATSVMREGSPLAATFWGFHFIVGAGIAIGLRRLVAKHGRERVFDDDRLARICVLAVDVTTAAAIAAIELDVIGRWLGPFLTFSAVAGILTVLGCVWAARRIFDRAPFSHALVLFGAATGTVSTGLALLRMIDPELRGLAARNTVIATALAVPITAPLFLIVIPFAVAQWPKGLWPSIVWPCVALAGYLVVLGVIWARASPAKLRRPLSSLWPREIAVTRSTPPL
jgi:ESS family glutamate:Na+ symporter